MLPLRQAFGKPRPGSTTCSGWTKSSREALLLLILEAAAMGSSRSGRAMTSLIGHRTLPLCGEAAATYYRSFSSIREEIRGLDRALARSLGATALNHLLAGASRAIGKRPRGRIVGAGIAPELIKGNCDLIGHRDRIVDDRSVSSSSGGAGRPGGHWLDMRASSFAAATRSPSSRRTRARRVRSAVAPGPLNKSGVIRVS